MMPTYLIATATVSDREAFIKGHGRKAAVLLEKFGGTYFMQAPGAGLLEGDCDESGSAVVSEWPSRKAALG